MLNLPKNLSITTETTPSPVTFTVVLAMSNKRSVATIIPIPSIGIPTTPKTTPSVTRLAEGTAATPIDIIEDFLQKGIIGSISKFHYSIMGYQGRDTSHLINFSGPEIAKSMKQDNVDLAILAPV